MTRELLAVAIATASPFLPAPAAAELYGNPENCALFADGSNDFISTGPSDEPVFYVDTELVFGVSWVCSYDGECIDFALDNRIWTTVWVIGEINDNSVTLVNPDTNIATSLLACPR